MTTRSLPISRYSVATAPDTHIAQEQPAMSYHSDLDIIGETPNLANAQAYAQRYAIATAPDTHIARPMPDLNGTLTFREAFAAAAEVNRKQATYSTAVSKRASDRDARKQAGV